MTQNSDTLIQHEHPSIDQPEGIIDAELFYPESEHKLPGVILLTDINGTRPSFENMARRIAAHGFVVLLPNIYYRNGPAPVLDYTKPFTDEAAKSARLTLRATLTPDRVKADIGAELDFLGKHPRVQQEEFGVVGYCLTGSFALRAAADYPDQIAAAASFHGGGLATDDLNSPHLRASDVKAQLYFGHADQDQSSPAEAIAKLEAALSQAGVDFRSEIYEGARHGFAVTDAASYNREASERHWGNLLELFETALK